MSYNPEIRFRVPADVIDQIRARPDCQPDRPGKTGGVSLWAKRLVLREMGAAAPLDPHEAQAMKFAGAVFESKPVNGIASVMAMIEAAQAMAKQHGLELTAYLGAPGSGPPMPPKD